MKSKNYLPGPKPLCVLVDGTTPYSLEELLLGVEQDVLLASDNGDALPAQPGDGVGGGGSHTHGEGDLLRVVVQLTVSPHCIGLYFSPPVISVVNSSCIS